MKYTILVNLPACAVTSIHRSDFSYRRKTMNEDNDEPINTIGISDDFVFKVKRVFRQKKNGELVEKYGERNQSQKVTIYCPEDSHPFVIGYYGVHESLKGVMIIDAILHRDRQDTVVVFVKDWANRNDKSIKRNFFTTFESMFAATTFLNVYNHVLKNNGAEERQEENLAGNESEIDEDDLYSETQPSIDPYYPDLFE